LEAARPLRTTPVYERLQAHNAVFGEYCALEHPLWFAPQGSAAREQVSFRRSNAHAVVGEECRAVREAVGLLEISNYGKFEVTGPSAAAWLSSIMANHVPAVGRIALAPMLNQRGRLIGDFTLCRSGEQRFFLVGTYAAERYYQRWFERHMPASGVTVRACAMEYVGLSLAGPRSRELLQSLVDADLSTSAFPFMSFRALDVGMVPALVGRVSFTGDLGYEIWVTGDYQRALFDLLTQAGGRFGLRHFGGRALNAMRLEKSFGTWAREYRPIYGPYEASLGRFVDLRKGAFIGREAALAEQVSGGERRLVTLDVAARDADAIGDEPIWYDGRVVGWVTSGGYAHSVHKSLALGYVDRDVAEQTSGFEVELIGERRTAVRLAAAAFDPEGKRMRA
jgi:dimethylglycine dehydrogenase